MIINLHQLKKIPVVTKSGIKLGKVSDINFLLDTQTIFQYIVRPSFLSGRIFLIKVNQVLEISDRMVVDDAVLYRQETDEQVDKIIDNKVLGGLVTSEINHE